MKKLFLLLVLSALFASCEKLETGVVTNYSYNGTKGDYITEVAWFEYRVIQSDLNNGWTKEFGSDEKFTPQINVIENNSSEPITVWIEKNGVIIYTKTY